MRSDIRPVFLRSTEKTVVLEALSQTFRVQAGEIWKSIYIASSLQAFTRAVAVEIRQLNRFAPLQGGVP